MQQQKKHQKDFMTYAFGGAEHWNGRFMRDAHKELVTEMGLTDSHFDGMALTEAEISGWNSWKLVLCHANFDLMSVPFHFDAITENLVATLVELEVPQALIDEVVQIVGSITHRNDVLNR
jgi:hemoglobin